MMDKRGFLLGAASMVAVSPALAATGPKTAGVAARSADWQAQLNQAFALSDGSSHWTLTLQAVQPAAATEHCPACEQFSLEFVNHGSRKVTAGLHRLQAGDGRSQLIHLDDGGKAGPQTLRADFNLLLA